jgi:hypothetical protein
MPERPLKAREFLFAAEDHAIRTLAGREMPPERRVMWTILQLHYGDPWLHFEVHPQPSRGRVEVGLHFEGPAEENERAAGLLAGHAAEILERSGGAWEMEEWTASWRRLHRMFETEAFTPSLASEVGEALAGLVAAAHPVLVASGLADGTVARPQRAPSRPRRWERNRAR